MSIFVEIFFWGTGLILLVCGFAGLIILLHAIIEEVRIWRKKHPKVKSR